MRPFLPALLTTLLAGAAFAQTTPEWVTRSNQNTQLLLTITLKQTPEIASTQGVAAFDTEVSQFPLDRAEKERAEYRAAQAELRKRLADEKDPRVRQDIQILIDDAQQEIERSEADEKTFLQYGAVSRLVFYGAKGLLDDQVVPERRNSVVIRLRKYAGMEPGTKPLTVQAEELFRASLAKPGLLGPSKVEVEKDLEDSKTLINGIGLLLEKYKIQGYQEAYSKIREQADEYDAFVKKEVLPRVRTDFRLPPAIYAISLREVGVDYPIDDLAALAHKDFAIWQKQMQEIATRVAKQRKLPSSDYRDVIRALKKEQFEGKDILPHYQKRLAEIEDIIRKNHLVTLPERPAIIEIASAAETAQQPAPHMVPPPFVNNKGERGKFMLPLETKGEGGVTLKYDDFTFAAASWTLTAHEARPGHELQFDSMVERGTSQARALYAFNSTNVEGWGLYAEYFTLPYMPDEGKLISLQYRLMRAARAFLDPELQEGKITPEQAMKVLQDDVVLSKGFATEEVERYTFRMPGQAVSYFDGYTRLIELRESTEKALGKKFNLQRFHDFILSQGLLPPSLLRKAVAEDFIPHEK